MISSSMLLNKSRNQSQQCLTVFDHTAKRSNSKLYFHPLWNTTFNNTTKCDSNNDIERKINKPSSDNPYRQEIIQLQKELDQPCKACMYTGMAACAGLTLYFVKLATDETTLPKNRRFLWACSAGSVLAGFYRWHIG